MQDTIIYIDSSKRLNLQNQIRQKLVDGILNGSFPPGMKLPSSRKLAQQLDVARNTVVAAYQQLVADGYLVSRHRSGIFVSQEMLDARVGHTADASPAAQAESKAWARRVKALPAHWREVPGDGYITTSFDDTYIQGTKDDAFGTSYQALMRDASGKRYFCV